MDGKTDDRIAFVLVHGTWAPHAQWTSEGSEICTMLARSGESVVFQRPQWTGWNRFQSRHKAALEIEKSIEAVQDCRSIFLVAHSHGGSAVAYLLNRRPELQSLVDGVVYMSTPFISIKQRAGNEQLLKTIVLLVGFLVYGWLGILAAYALSAYGFTQRTDYAIPLALFGSTASATVAMLLVWRALAGVGEWNTSISFRADVLADAQDTCRLSLKDRSAFIRVTGDEAASVLSFWQFAAWSSSFLGDLLAMTVSTVHELLRNAATRTLVISIVWLLAVGAQMWVIGYVDAIRSEGFAYWPWEYVYLARIDFLFFEVTPAISFFLHAVTALALGAFVILLVGVLLLTLSLAYRFCVCLFGLRAFGIWAPVEALFVDYAVEPLPFGNNVFHHVDWKTLNSSDPVLFHSRSYTNPIALAHIQEWLRHRLAAKPKGYRPLDAKRKRSNSGKIS